MAVYIIHCNANDKYYVGKTIHSLNHRWQQHLNDSLRLDHPIQRALRKYGIEAFTVEELSSSIDEVEISILERLWIILLQSNNSIYGYNLTSGGEGTSGYKHREETKQKMRLAKLGRKLSPETIEKIRINSPHPQSEEARRKIGLPHKGKIVSNLTRKKQSLSAIKRWGKGDK